MHYYKDQNNDVFAFEEGVAVSPSFVMMAPTEVAAHLTVNTPMVDPWEAVRMQRNALLRETDAFMLADNPRSNNQELRQYRQNLRDVPQNFGAPNTVIWPTKPEVVS